jgi:hypothetical protein
MAILRIAYFKAKSQEEEKPGKRLTAVSTSIYTELYIDRFDFDSCSPLFFNRNMYLVQACDRLHVKAELCMYSLLLPGLLQLDALDFSESNRLAFSPLDADRTVVYTSSRR